MVVIRITQLLALALTVAASVWAFLSTRGNPTPLAVVFYPRILVPIAVAAIPFWKPEWVGWAALGILGFIFCPLSLSIGIFYIPALLGMGAATGVYFGLKGRSLTA
jgi:hypothetical protein